MSTGAKNTVRTGGAYTVASIVTFVSYGDLFSFVLGVIAYWLFWDGLRLRLLEKVALTAGDSADVKKA